MGVPYEILEHPADVGFRAYGRTVAELFENAALAMCSLGCAPERIEEREERDIAAQGSDIESLLYAWLAEVLAVADADRLVFHRMAVTLLREPAPGQPGEVRGTAYGETFDRQRHTAGTCVKAVTLHQFFVEPTADGFRAQVFVDV
ncbi:MAG: archease [Acidobacteriia bacterium]|nr:archease [Terriglobia bacterium]